MHPPDASGEQFTKRFQGDLACPALVRKIIRFRRRANHLYEFARLTRQEGRLAIVTKRAVGCGGRGSVGAQWSCRAGFPVSEQPARRTNGALARRKPGGCVGKTVVVLASVADAKSAEGFCKPDRV